ncbi:MAG: UDP-3-O-(3-hydroxymyristoyl)glucosamine N-acyltransferase [Zoogloeaceae bacterium]|jgi:UDP-3-O-[3-hydroxymyristoyl] glucosamine N-acyltransferase|nr:UDP-3-O-(3-hydroxymyristoyl)glucosamine N-acyltransferase [Zoogloeaceae bacterium]
MAFGASLTLAQIVGRLQAVCAGEIRGNAAARIHQVAPLQSAQAGEIAFLANPKYTKHLRGARASAVILHPDMAPSLPLTASGEPALAAILTLQPYVYYARVAALLNPVARWTAGTHPAAVVESDIPASCHIGPGVWIGPGVTLGENVAILAHARIGADVVIGADSVIHPGVSIYPRCRIGARAILHSGAVIGADGFGFAPDFGGAGQDEWVKIPQIGRVVMGDDVEIGANTSIDRGALEDTVIGDGCKLDNQIQIGHNCVIGEYTVIAGCVGVAGSARIGHHCAIGGAAMILGHLEIAAHTEISPGSMVMKSIPCGGEKYTALYPLERHADWLKNAAQLRHLEALAKRIKALEALAGSNAAPDGAGALRAER